jgi:hypothetical protein
MKNLSLNSRLSFPISGGGPGRHPAGVRITLRDVASSLVYLQAEISGDDFLRLLSGQGEVPVGDVEVYYSDKLGKTLQTDKFIFPFKYSRYGYGIEEQKRQYKDAYATALAEAARIAPGDWEPDNYWNSQSSFRRIDGVECAEAIIRRWG